VPASAADTWQAFAGKLKADARGLRRYAGCMRYAQGGGLTAEGRRRREQVRLEAVNRFEQRAPAAVIAAELRVRERSVRRWRRAWLAGGRGGLPRAGDPVPAG
jgi:Homeodomain-like domain